jgi:hypothetical protein
MCMITYVPANVEIPEYGIENGAFINDDGHGWAIAADIGCMLTGRYMDFDQAMTSFKIARKAYPQAPALFHSRWATHGVKGPRNVHPFQLGKYAVVAHNGVLPVAFHPEKDDPRSDTAIMAEDWLNYQSKGGRWTRNERRRIGMAIGGGNKLCILSVSPRFDKPRGFLVNQAYGEWRDGAWFSNDGFRGWSRRYSGGTRYSSFDDYWDSKSSAYGTGWTGSTSPKGEADDSEPLPLLESTSKELEHVKNECRFCGALDRVDTEFQFCTICLTCQDCELVIGGDNPCLCNYGSAMSRGIIGDSNCAQCGELAPLCDCPIFVPNGWTHE